MSWYSKTTIGADRQKLVDAANKDGGFAGLYAVTNSSEPAGRLTNPFDIGQAVCGKNPDAKLLNWSK